MRFMSTHNVVEYLALLVSIFHFTEGGQGKKLYDTVTAQLYKIRQLQVI